MSISLSASGVSIALPDDLCWADQYAWTPVEQVVERSVTGALLVQSAARLGGAPITLQALDESSAWMTLATVQQLTSWAATPLQQMVLSINGADHSVIFRHQDGALEAKPVVFYSDPQSTDHYLATLRFMEL